ncbi:MAG TPA: ABC transporter permease [Anaerolineae bacterium]|nr:ABC transporter permease [Anaerolineae bacterium]
MRSYLPYLGQRLLILVATIIISMTIVFLVPRLVPGDPMGAILAKLSAVGAGRGNEALIKEYSERFGLNKPIPQQYVDFLVQLAQGNLGYSIAAFPARVSDMIMAALPWTIGLLAVTTVLSWIIGSVLGALVGWRETASVPLRAFVVLALIAYTTPYYILAIILLFIFAFLIPIFPLAGAFDVGVKPALTLSFAANVIEHAALPALSIVLVSLGWWFLSMRSLITSLKGEDYILWAQAKGLSPNRILWSYAFRNALLPQATGLALSLGYLVGGALVTEVIFGYPGVGYLIFNSIKGLDYPVIQGSVLLIIISVAVTNFLLDMIYPLLDPRIQEQAGG